MRRLGLFLPLLLATPAAAGLLEPPSIVQPTVAGSPAGYTVNDIQIDFEGRFYGHQMLVQLTEGSIYQDPLGGRTAPPAALLPIVPSLAADSFVTVGGLTAEASKDVLIVGFTSQFRHLPLDPERPRSGYFNESEVDLAWYAAPGIRFDNGEDLPVARLTLSDDARGLVHLFSSVGGTRSQAYSTWEVDGGANWSLTEFTNDPGEPIDPVDPVDPPTPVAPFTPVPAVQRNARMETTWNDTPDGPEGYVGNRIGLSFDGRLYGQQLVVQLDSGSIYQDDLGAETAPNPALFSFAPTVEQDSFVTVGGWDSSDSQGVFVVGRSVNLGSTGPLQFDEAGINVTWAPLPGVVVEGGYNYPLAQLTLSDDANGRVYLFSDIDGVENVFHATISNGYLNGIPEPSTAGLAFVMAVAGIGSRSRQGWKGL